MNQRGAGGSHVDFFRTVIVQTLDIVLELGAADDRVLTEEQTPVLYQFPDGDQLHLCHQVPDGLVLRHEASRPGGRIFHERSAIGNPGLVSETDGIRCPRVGDARNHINFPVFLVGQCHTTAVSRGFDIDLFIMAGRVPVVDPEEGANLQPVPRCLLLLHSLFVDERDLSRPEEMFGFVAEVWKRAGLHRRRPCTWFLPDDDWRASQPVTGGVDTFIGQEQHRTRSVNSLLGPGNSVGEGGLLIDEHGCHFCGVQIAAAHLREMGRPPFEGLLDQAAEVVDATHGNYGIGAEM